MKRPDLTLLKFHSFSPIKLIIIPEQDLKLLLTDDFDANKGSTKQVWGVFPVIKSFLHVKRFFSLQQHR